MYSTECPSGFQEISEFCFKMGTGEKTFDDATKSCQELGGFLAEPRSEELSKAVKYFHQNQNFFIGLKYNGQKDSDGNRIFLWQTDNAALSWKDWDVNQPNNRNGKQYCVGLNRKYRWDDLSCELKRGYLCQARTGKYMYSFFSQDI